MSSYQQEWPAPAVAASEQQQQQQQRCCEAEAQPQRVSEWRWPPARRLAQMGLAVCALLLMLALAMPTEDKGQSTHGKDEQGFVRAVQQ